MFRSILSFCVLSTLFLSSHVVLGGIATFNIADKGASKSPIKHVYLDFDHTISVDGFSGDIRNIFCKQEEYPECNCASQPGGKCDGAEDEMVTSLKTLEGEGIPALIESMGGKKRLTKFQKWLKYVRGELNGNVFMVSTSWFPVTALQWKLYLEKVSDDLGLGFDSDHIFTLADPGVGKSADKGAVIKSNMEKHEINYDEAVFADDSSGNIKSALSVCKTVYLPKKEGLKPNDMKYIKKLMKVKGKKGGDAPEDEEEQRFELVGTPLLQEVVKDEKEVGKPEEEVVKDHENYYDQNAPEDEEEQRFELVGTPLLQEVVKDEKEVGKPEEEVVKDHENYYDQNEAEVEQPEQEVAKDHENYYDQNEAEVEQPEERPPKEEFNDQNEVEDMEVEKPVVKQPIEEKVVKDTHKKDPFASLRNIIKELKDLYHN